jgi:oligopeptide/dipeptide ABC transporter ATP-binding protein
MSPLLEVRQLKTYFKTKTGKTVKAVDDVSFAINEGETLGLVGESGCGKTTMGRSILRLVEPTSGEIYFEGQNLLELRKGEMRQMRRNMQIVFQDPYGSLHPRMTVRQTLEEPFKIHGFTSTREQQDRAVELLQLVGLPREHLDRYPHQFSGGQRQRVGIARALALNPKFIVCDEPVSALDVSIQSQIINLLCDLQAKLGLTYLFIAHGLHVVKHISDRVGVMYLGKLVELADSQTLYAEPKHPYTQALLSAIPVPDPDRKSERIVLHGDVPSPINPPVGCRFCTRCPFVMEECRKVEPPLKDTGGGHYAACHLL